jgi:hypothetical protein
MLALRSGVDEARDDVYMEEPDASKLDWIGGLPKVSLLTSVSRGWWTPMAAETKPRTATTRRKLIHQSSVWRRANDDFAAST